MVLFSTPQSLKNKETSFLAIIELILAVGIYWGIAVYYDIYWHLIFSIIITPLLLLSSKKSIKMGIRLIYHLSKGNNLSHTFSIGLTFIIGISSFSYLFGYLIPNLKNVLFIEAYIVFMFLGAFFASDIIFGVQALNNKQQEKENFLTEVIAMILIFLLLPIIGIGMGLTILSIFTLYKIIAITVNLKHGYKNIGLNWFYYCFILDLRKNPETMINIDNYKSINNIYKFSNFLTIFKSKDSFFRKIMFIVMYITLYPFAIFYRLSIKSTFWFYIPLLFVVKSPNLNSSQNIGKFLSELYATIWAWIRTLLAFGTISAFFVTSFQWFNWNVTHHEDSPINTILMALYIDFSSLELWKIFQILVAILTIGLFVYANVIRKPSIDNNIPLKNDFNIQTIFYLNSLRNWLSFFYMISAFIFIANYFEIWTYRYVPNFFHDFFTTILIYIQYLPFGDE